MFFMWKTRAYVWSVFYIYSFYAKLYMCKYGACGTVLDAFYLHL